MSREQEGDIDCSFLCRNGVAVTVRKFVPDNLMQNIRTYR